MTKARTNADNASADIQGVTAGTGLSGGGTSGTVTLTNDMATTIAAKGDLVVGTGNDTYAALTAGNSGDTLVADSSATTGLRWQGNYQAGKNLVINGNMSVSQRGTSFTSLSTGATYTLDRFEFRNNNLGAFTVSQESDAPAGFGKSLKALVTTADAAPAASDFCIIRQKIEGQALQALQKGTATAQATTVSFWVKSNLTGTYIATLYDNSNARQIAASYTINSSATWEKKTITFVGDTTGAIADTSATGMTVQFWLGSGSDRTAGSLQTTWAADAASGSATGQVNLAATLNNYFQITGIQWEIGSVATAFQLSAGTLAGELAACQRYFNNYGLNTSGFALGQCYSTTVARFFMQIPQMRVAPTVSIATAGDFALTDANGTFINLTSFTTVTNTVNNVVMDGAVASGLVAGNASWVRLNSGSGKYFYLSAEL